MAVFSSIHSKPEHRRALLGTVALTCLTLVATCATQSARAQALSGGAGGNSLLGGSGAGGGYGSPGAAGNWGNQYYAGGGGGGGADAAGGAGGTTLSINAAGGSGGAAGVAGGGAGGNGGAGSVVGGQASGGGGGGGGGGAGSTISTTTTINANATGGAGGGGGAGGSSSFAGSGGGGGGAGGEGILGSSGAITIGSSVVVSGGAGGIGGAGGSGGSAIQSASGGGGGAGGIGVNLTTGASLINNGTLQGGSGGAGGAPGAVGGGSGSGGAGGYGVYLSSGTTLTNAASGVITGGAGAGAAAGGAGVFASGGTLINAGTISGGTGASAVAFTSTGNTLTLLGASVINGNISVNSGALTFDQSSAGSVSLSNAITGNGAVSYNGGANTITLTGGNSYSGATTVSSGTLVVNGSIASSSLTTVASGATLGGVGTVGALSVASGGVFAPGSGVAASTMTVSGNLTLAAGAVYQININPTAASLANVSGTATLTGASVQAFYAAGSYLSNTYTILHTGGLGGTTFASLAAIGLPSGFSETLAYSATDVQLKLTANLPTPSNNTPNFGNGLGSGNAGSVANAITAYFNNGGALPPTFVGLFNLSGSQLNAALGQLAGQQQGAFAQGGFEAGGAFLGMMLNPHADGRGGAIGGVPAGAPLAYAGDNATAPSQRAIVAIAPASQSVSPASSSYTAWASAFGGGGTTGGDAALGAAQVASSYYGVAAGLDYSIAPGINIGAAMGGGGSGFSLAQGLGSGHSDFEQLGVYGQYNLGRAYISTAFAGSIYQVSSTRIGALVGNQVASFTAPGVSNRTELGYGLEAGGGVKLTPYLANQVQALFLPSFTENGGAGSTTSLFYNSRSTYDDRTEVGAGFEHVYPELHGALKIFGRVAFAHDFTNEGVSSISFVSLPGAGFTSYSARIAPNSALTTLGAEIRLGDGWSLGGKFDGQFASSGSNFSGNAVLRKTW